jgi:hypothetical protein
MAVMVSPSLVSECSDGRMPGFTEVMPSFAEDFREGARWGQMEHAEVTAGDRMDGFREGTPADV